MGKYRHYSLIAGTSGDKRRKLTAFSCLYSATGGTRTRTRMAAPIEYEFDAINTVVQREVSKYQLDALGSGSFGTSEIPRKYALSRPTRWRVELIFGPKVVLSD